MTFCAHQMRRRRRDVSHSLFVLHHTPHEDFIPVISLELPQSRTMKYSDLKKNWRKVRRHLVDEELNDVLVRDFNKFTYGRWRKKFTPGCFPSEFETSDWSLDHRGRRPAFWKYTASHACHWLVNFSLRLAMLVEPERPWRIVTSSKHSTIWDGANTIFEFNFQAFGIDATECFNAAIGKELRPGRYRKVHFAKHFKIEP